MCLFYGPSVWFPILFLLLSTGGHLPCLLLLLQGSRASFHTLLVAIHIVCKEMGIFIIIMYFDLPWASHSSCILVPNLSYWFAFPIVMVCPTNTYLETFFTSASILFILSFDIVMMTISTTSVLHHLMPLQLANFDRLSFLVFANVISCWQYTSELMVWFFGSSPKYTTPNWKRFLV